MLKPGAQGGSGCRQVPLHAFSPEHTADMLRALALPSIWWLILIWLIVSSRHSWLLFLHFLTCSRDATSSGSFLVSWATHQSVSLACSSSSSSPEVGRVPWGPASQPLLFHRFIPLVTSSRLLPLDTLDPSNSQSYIFGLDLASDLQTCMYNCLRPLHSDVYWYLKSNMLEI